MSSGSVFRLACEAEDGALRAVLRGSHMPGDISLAFGREPSFFIAEQAGNLSHQTIAYRHQGDGKITGVGSRGIREAYIDGKKRLIGYLSSLRLLPESRNGMTLVRGYRFLRHLHDDGLVPYYLTTILDENAYAKSILESGRAGMPTYVPIGTLITHLIPIKNRPHRSSRFSARCILDANIPCRPVTDADTDSLNEGILSQAHQCLSEWNAQHQFAPSYEAGDLTGKSGLLPNFSPKDLWVCQENGKVVGTLGVWNQQSFKQTVVADYSTRMKMIRPFYNGMARLKSRPTLPNIGETINSVHAACISVRDNDPGIFASLIKQAIRVWSCRGHDYLLVGLTEGHPLSSTARSFASRELRSKIYLVHWPDQKVPLPVSKNGRIVHLEVATL